MSRFFVFIFTYIQICFPAQAQKLISSTGGDIISNNSGSVSYSIGEHIISTISGGSNGDVTQGYQQPISLSTKLIDNFCTNPFYDVNTFNSTDIIAKPIGANQYIFTFTEVDQFGNNINNPSIFTSTRNSNVTRLSWAFDANNQPISDLDKTYKVEVEGVFSYGKSLVNEYCIINSPKSNNLSTSLIDLHCNSNPFYEVPSFNSSNLLAKNIGANQYIFTFTEVDQFGNNINNPAIYTSTRNNNVTRLSWALNSNNQAISDFNKTYKVEVVGVFSNGNTAVTEYCYIKTPPNNISTKLINSQCTTNPFYEVPSFNSSNLIANNIGANQYIFTFTEVDQFGNAVSNPEIYSSTRNNNVTRLNWAFNSSNQAISGFDKTFKVEVEGVFSSGNTTISDHCFIKTPTNNLTTKLIDRHCHNGNTAYEVPSFFSSNLIAKPIGAKQYRFTFTEVNPSNFLPLTPTPDPYVSVRNNYITRLGWARNSSGEKLYSLNKTYEVKVEGIFLNSVTSVIDVCYIKTPNVLQQPFNNTAYLSEENKTKQNELVNIKNNLSKNMHVFPNPNNGDVIYIEFFNEGLTNDLQMKILDINGRIIESRKIDTESGLNKKEIILKTPLSKGIYFMQIKNGLFITTKKIQVL